jgi:hypothetical protein
MAKIENLLKNYERHVSIPWSKTNAGPERVWFAVYEPSEERRLRLRLQNFEVATAQAEHGWKEIDLTNSFPEWLKNEEYHESYFAEPESLTYLLSDFLDHLAAKINDAFSTTDEADNTVFALTGLATLFGVGRISDLIEKLESKVVGRLLCFFPGQYVGNTYRFLDARDGWNYLAVPITSEESIYS